MSSVEKKKCFVITPIGEETDPIRRHIDGIIDAAITPALGGKYDILVSHKICEPGTITKQIISEIYNDELVIANLTNRNPNVMYELAFRHSLGKPVIMIAEKGTVLPADIIMQRTIFYCNDAKGVLELRDDLKRAENELSFDKKSGPIYDILGDLSHDTAVLQRAQDNASETEPLQHILNRLNRIEDAVLSQRSSVSSLRPEILEIEYPKIVTMMFEYGGLKNKMTAVDEEQLREVLSNVKYKIDIDANVVQVFVNKEAKEIVVEIVAEGPLYTDKIYEYFKTELARYGFTDIKKI